MKARALTDAKSIPIRYTVYVGKKKYFERLLQSQKNVHFADFEWLVKAFGFVLIRTNILEFQNYLAYNRLKDKQNHIKLPNF